ncbi:MAG: PEP-CTERM sorting domain-containing protein [Armatimonadetes bacterium]|nr:PEP-CTERM sorting domain-containing protein [Armatimonadota bacterium]
MPNKYIFLTVAAMVAVALPVHGQTVLAGSGDHAAVLSVVNQYRTLLGPLNANTPGVGNPNGRREINWDAVGDAFSDPNLFPGNFLNAPVAPRARGAEFTTPGSGFLLSADDSNPTNTPVEYARINASYPNEFAVFSQQRLFTALDSVITDVRFFVAGTNFPATVTGFGAVFTDIDLPDSTKMEYYDANNSLIYSIFVPAGVNPHESFSFAGVKFADRIVSRVRIFSGNAAMGLNSGPNDDPLNGHDVVVMDDFIYGEPVPEPASMAVLGGGLIALAVRSRRRKQ